MPPDTLFAIFITTYDISYYCRYACDVAAAAEKACQILKEIRHRERGETYAIRAVLHRHAPLIIDYC
jgi:hypothetical protein